MSKVKEAYVKQLEDEFELDLSYQEWLRDNVGEPNESEINEMEQDFLQKPHFECKLIISDKPLNNHNYNPTHTV